MDECKKAIDMAHQAGAELYKYTKKVIYQHSIKPSPMHAIL